jgi:hypothetical protein
MTLLHGVVRTLIVELGFEASIRTLALSHYHLHENPNRSGFRKMSPRQLQDTADWLYRLDQEERIVASCYSVALTVDLLAFSQGESPALLLGLRKLDEHLLGHAWLQMPSGRIINPGRQSLENMVIMKRLVMADMVNQWAREESRPG